MHFAHISYWAATPKKGDTRRRKRQVAEHKTCEVHKEPVDISPCERLICILCVVHPKDEERKKTLYDGNLHTDSC